MVNALIGYTGFVGGTLAQSRTFEHQFNSKNIGDIRGHRYDLVVCAGAKAAKWLANKDPETDLAEINSLIADLDTISADRFVLMSTIDVFGASTRVDEASVPDENGLHAYGLHRLKLEAFVKARFQEVSIIRLPGLFGPGLRKNLIFDLINDNQTTLINPLGKLQWYATRRLAADTDAIVASGVPLIHVAPEPVATSEILERFFPGAVVGEPRLPAPDYDIRTLHADVLGGEGDYHFSKAEVLDELDAYIASEFKERV